MVWVLRLPILRTRLLVWICIDFCCVDCENMSVTYVRTVARTQTPDLARQQREALYPLVSMKCYAGRPWFRCCACRYCARGYLFGYGLNFVMLIVRICQ